MASSTGVRRVLAALLVLLVVVAGGAAAALGASATSTTTPATIVPPVRLVYETPFVSAAHPLLSLSFSRTGPALAAGASVQLTLYGRLTTRSGLEAAITPGVGPSQPVSTSGRLSASCLAVGDQLRLTVPVAPDGAQVRRPTLCGARSSVLRLGCASGCDGVYPLRATVRGGGVTAALLALVTYASTSSSPLRVVWLLRVGGVHHGLAQSDGALRALAAYPKVAVTVDVQGSTVAAVGTSSAAVGALHALRALAAPDQLLGESFVPVDLGALRASGLRSEVKRQYALDEVFLKIDGVRTLPARTVTYGTGPQTVTGENALASIGFRHVIVEGPALQQDPASTQAWGYAFRFAGAPQGPTALAADTPLSELTDDTSSDPGLAASQFLGELAFLHFEAPDLAAPRAVVVVTDASRLVTTSFVAASLAGLTRNPILDAVTASSAFRDVPLGSGGFPSVRALALGAPAPLPAATSGTIAALRRQTDALSSAVTGGATPIPGIEGQLLGAEAVGLTAAEQAAMLDHVRSLLDQQKALFHIYDGTITLTEAGATLPITVFSSAPYAVDCTLVLSSGKLEFPAADDHHSAAFPLVLNGSVASVRVVARALVTGDLPMAAKLYSPDGRLVLAHALITVRATGTSVVGIALTALALFVLALWWVRSFRQRRAART